MQIELADISNELESLNDDVIMMNHVSILLMNELQQGYRLQKKHGVQSTSELIGYKK